MKENLQKTILAIKQRGDIVNEMRALGYELKSAGPNRYKCCCPFHKEKTPSLVVYEENQDYHCFGCGAHGDIITLFQETHQLTFMETLNVLCEKLKIEPIEKDGKESFVATKNHHKALEETWKFYKICLKAAKRDAIEDIKGREIKDINGIGWAPTSSESRKFWQDLGLDKNTLEEVGLISKKGYPVFTNRLIFPLRNQIGKIVGFTGRTYDEKDNRKYLNTGSTPIFHKTKILYNLYESKKSIQREKKVYIAEGTFDVLKMVEKGYDNTVATCGTSFTQEHMRILDRLTNQGKIVFVMDGDSAGQKSMYRVFESMGEIQSQSSVIVLPEDDDPCSYLKTHEKLPEEEPMLEHIYKMWKKKLDKKTIEEKVEISKKAHELFVKKIKEPSLRDHYQRKVYTWVGVEGRVETKEETKKEQKGVKKGRATLYLNLFAFYHRYFDILKDRLKEEDIEESQRNFLKELQSKKFSEEFDNPEKVEMIFKVEVPNLEKDQDIISYFDYMLRELKKVIEKG